MNLFHNILHEPDEIGCARPVYLDEDDSNNLIIFFYEKPTKEQIDFIKERSKTFNKALEEKCMLFSFEKPNIEFLGFELKRYINITVETIKI